MNDRLTPIPTPDPIALPGPEPAIHVLLIAGFILHALFMNVVLGGTPIMIVTEWIAQRSPNLHFARLAKTLAALVPTALGFAVVLGVAPLLFVQAVYGQFMYTAAILIGNVWAGLIVMVIVGYSGLYFHKYGRAWLPGWPRLHFAVGAVSVVMFLCTALVFVTMNVVMINPEHWLSVYRDGFFTAIQLPSVLPRYLHMVLAALAGAGMVLVLYGAFLQTKWGELTRARWEIPADYGSWLVRYGAGWTMAGTLPQIVIGPWLLMSLPADVRGVLIDGASTPSIVFFSALTFALLGIVLLNAAILAPQARRLALFGVGSLATTMMLMAVVRDRVRAISLTPHFDPSTLSTLPQWGFIAIFVVFFLVGLGFIAYLVRVFIRAPILKREDAA